MASVPQQPCCMCLEHVDTTALPISTPSAPGVAAFVCDNPLCRTVYCVPCLRQLFRTVIANPALLPLRCCDQQELMTDATLALVDDEEKTALVLRRAERQSPEPLYCPEPKCSAFIPQAKSGDGVASPTTAAACCPRCGTRVCRSCHGRAHDDDNEQQRKDSTASSRSPCQRANVHRNASLMAVLREQGCHLW